ncbi:MAG: anti-sigma factor family protein [Candidatus Alkaliphilus sp. MAG34]
MDCKDFQTYGSAYIDNMLSGEEKSDFEDHIKKCTACGITFKNLKTIVKSLSMLEDVELPVHFSDELHKKLENAKNRKPKSILSNKNRVLKIAAMLLIFVLSLPLINNSLNHNKESSPHFVTDDAVQEEENANAGIAPDRAKGETSDEGDNEKSIMSLEMAPIDKNETIEDKTNRNVSEKEMRGDVAKDKGEGNYNYTGSSEKPNEGEKSTINNKSIQSLLDDKNLNGVFGLVLVLVLVTGIIVLIYKIIRK